MYGRLERDHRRLGGRVDNDCKVFLGGLAPRWTEDDILSFMSKFGRIVNISIVKTNTGESKGFGFVVFETPEEAYASLGQIKYCSKIVDVKQSFKQQNDQQSSNIRVSSSRMHKEVLSGRAGNDNSNKQLSSKLSKHSKDFQTLAPVSDSDLGDMQEDSRVSVNIIELTNKEIEDKSYLHSHHFTDSSDHSNVKHVKKSDERNFGMSKLSKEFHPASSVQEHPTQGAAQSYIGPFSTMAGLPFGQALFMPFPATDTAHVYDMHKVRPDGLGLPPASASADLKISFFTFPGRD